MIRTVLPTLLIGVLFLSLTACGAAGKTDNKEDKAAAKATYILVRHAEKADDGTKDPPLNDTGRARADRLARLLHSANVGAIYSTDYQRTRQTAMPLATKMKLDITSYEPMSLEALEKIRQETGGKTVLIVGHSNTIPVIANQLLGTERFEQLAENEYDKLFIITRIGELAEITLLNY
jgi:broad specificity phosphatase PhoE